MATLGHQWKHNWIPLTPAAALIKAKGSHAVAGRLRKRYGVNARDTRAVVRSSRQTRLDDRPSSADRQREAMARRVVEQAEERRRTAALRQMSDDQLADHLAEVADDEKAVERVLAELDRRDNVAAAARRRAEARTRARQAKEAAQEAEWERRMAAGEDAEEAYAAAYGTTVERMRKQEAINLLRGSGYKGRNFDELVRNAHQDHAYQAWLDAENVTRGVLLNRAGKSAGVNARSLFTGPESRARKYASEELLSYWQEHGRMTVDDFTASLLGGHMRSAGTAAFA